MSGRYDDIIHLPRPVSKRRKHMSLIDRAAQFSPFAALTGFEDAIAETGRLTDRQIDFDVDGIAMLDGKLRFLADRVHLRPEVTVTYFVPDEHKSGGAYVRASGRVRRIDPWQQSIQLEDGTTIEWERVRAIESELFGAPEQQ